MIFARITVGKFVLWIICSYHKNTRSCDELFVSFCKKCASACRITSFLFSQTSLWDNTLCRDNIVCWVILLSPRKTEWNERCKNSHDERRNITEIVWRIVRHMEWVKAKIMVALFVPENEITAYFVVEMKQGMWSQLGHPSFLTVVIARCLDIERIRRRR